MAAPAKQGAPQGRPVAANRGRPRRAVEARPSGLTRIVIDHLTRLVAELVQEQRRLVADELAAYLT
jgi:hypothetical protein